MNKNKYNAMLFVMISAGCFSFSIRAVETVGHCPIDLNQISDIENFTPFSKYLALASPTADAIITSVMSYSKKQSADDKPILHTQFISGMAENISSSAGYNMFYRELMLPKSPMKSNFHLFSHEIYHAYDVYVDADAYDREYLSLGKAVILAPIANKANHSRFMDYVPRYKYQHEWNAYLVALRVYSELRQSSCGDQVPYSISLNMTTMQGEMNASPDIEGIQKIVSQVPAGICDEFANAKTPEAVLDFFMKHRQMFIALTADTSPETDWQLLKQDKFCFADCIWRFNYFFGMALQKDNPMLELFRDDPYYIGAIDSRNEMIAALARYGSPYAYADIANFVFGKVNTLTPKRDFPLYMGHLEIPKVE